MNGIRVRKAVEHRFVKATPHRRIDLDPPGLGLYTSPGKPGFRYATVSEGGILRAPRGTGGWLRISAPVPCTGTPSRVTIATLDGVPLCEERLVLICEADHPPVRGPQDVAGRAVFTFRRSCAYRTRLETWFSHERVAMGRRLRSSPIKACSPVSSPVLGWL